MPKEHDQPSRLASVTHLRCHQRTMTDPETRVWVDAEMTQAEFVAFVHAAQEAYDKAGKDFEQAEQPPYAQWGMPDFSKFPDRTVAAVTAEHEAKQTAYNTWKKRKEEAQQDFGHHLEKVSGGRIQQFWKVTPALSASLDWGHRHGQDVAYGATEINDLPGRVEREDWP